MDGAFALVRQLISVMVAVDAVREGDSIGNLLPDVDGSTEDPGGGVQLWVACPGASLAHLGQVLHDGLDFEETTLRYILVILYVL